MNRFATSLIILVLSLNMGYSQDTIYTNSGKSILSKVLNVSVQELEYKKFENPNGPIYKMELEDIEKVAYENGSVDVFYETASETEK